MPIPSVSKRARRRQATDSVSPCPAQREPDNGPGRFISIIIRREFAQVRLRSMSIDQHWVDFVQRLLVQSGLTGGGFRVGFAILSRRMPYNSADYWYSAFVCVKI